MKLQVRALVTMPAAKRGAVLTVEDGASIRKLIERGRYELVAEIADGKPKKPKFATAPVSDADPA